MAQAAIRTDLDQALDVHLNLAAQIALHLVMLCDIFADEATSASVRSLMRVSGLTLVSAKIF